MCREADVCGNGEEGVSSGRDTGVGDVRAMGKKRGRRKSGCTRQYEALKRRRGEDGGGVG